MQTILFIKNWHSVFSALLNALLEKRKIMKSLRTEILQLFVDNSLNILLLSHKKAMTDFDT